MSPLVEVNTEVANGSSKDEQERERSWVVEVNTEVANGSSQDEHKNWKKRSIYKVPSSVISDQNKKAYRPQTVSFGPYHHNDDHLKAMEGHKRRALCHFLRTPGKSLETIFNSLVEVAQELKDSYDSLDDKWRGDTDGFVRLMILDSCFMFEILRASREISNRRPNGYDKDDPIFGDHGSLYVMPFIRRDMLLLENQLPMIVLFKLLCRRDDDAQDIEYLNKLILEFCNSADSSKLGKSSHVLDLYRKSLLKKDINVKPLSQDKTYDGRDALVIRSATELDEAGISFKRSKTKYLNDISLKGGVLRLPRFVVDDTTEPTFLNLIAFERCQVGAGHEITTFVCFMDNIVDNPADISLLSSKGIVQNIVGSDKAAAHLFNTMSKDLTMDPDSELNSVHLKIVSYCRKPWNKWRANLIHTYFRSPWAIISVLAAICLFALTLVQTIYTVLQYKQG